MNNNIPKELSILFELDRFDSMVFRLFIQNNIKKNKCFNNLSYVQLKDLFKSYLANEYIELERDEYKLAYLRLFQNEMVLKAFLNDFIDLFKVTVQTDTDLKNIMFKDILELSKLKKFGKHPYFKLLEKYNDKIIDIIKNEENIMSHIYRYNIDEILYVSKCDIVKEMIEEDEPYGIINSIDNGFIELDIAVINAFEIYKNGIKNLNERKLEVAIKLNKLENVTRIYLSNGNSR